MNVIRAQHPEIANIWSLVLHSRGIGHTIRFKNDHIEIVVEDGRYREALQEIETFERENYLWPNRPKATYELKRVEGILFVCIIVSSILSLFVSDALRPTLFDIGANQRDAVLRGQWWRPVTALTLHVDPVHLLSNMSLGTIFLILLANMVGPPLAWTLVVSSGVLGNFISIILNHNVGSSVGASTAVFGALGSISGFLFIRAKREKYSFGKPFIYFGAGVALLSFLGVGDETTDRMAHLTGFFIGILLGGLIGVNPESLVEFGKRRQFLIFSMLIFIVIVSWAAAINVSGKWYLIVDSARYLMSRLW